MFNTGYLSETLFDEAEVTEDVVSAAIDMSRHEHFSVQFTWTSTNASASLVMEESNDGENWAVYDSTKNNTINNDNDTVIRTSNSTGAGLFEARYLRAKVDYSSGTITTVKAVFFAKP